MRRHGLGLLGMICAFALALAGPIAGPVAPARGQEAEDAAELKVMERFLAVLEKTPRRGTALDRVYGYHVEHGTLDALVGRFEERAKKDPNDGEGWMLLGLVEAQRGRDAAAVAAFRDAERLRPDDPLAPYYLGQALVLVGQPDTAVDAFERALARKPPARRPPGDLPGPRPGPPACPPGRQGPGRLGPPRSDLPRRRPGSRADRRCPGRGRPAGPGPGPLREPWPGTSRTNTAGSSSRSSRPSSRSASAGRPRPWATSRSCSPRLDPGSWLFKEVRRKVEEVFLRGDDLAGLAKYYEGWIARTPEDVDAMARLGRTYAQLGRAADSRAWLDKAVALAPSRRDLRLALIEQLSLEKKFADASAQYEMLVKAEPNNPDLVRDWGRLLLRDTSKPEADRKKAASAVWKRLVGRRGEGRGGRRPGGRPVPRGRDGRRRDRPLPAGHRPRARLGPVPRVPRRIPPPAQATRRRPGHLDGVAGEGGRREGPARRGPGRLRLQEGSPRPVRPGREARARRLRPPDQARRPPRRPRPAQGRAGGAGGRRQAGRRPRAVPRRRWSARSPLIRRRRSSASGSAASGRTWPPASDATADRWTRLARYDEADGKATEAIASASKATAVDPRSIAAWATLGRLQEGAGNFSGAVEASRKLAGLDRRNRAEYLSAIARLEARLGRVQEALKAGRELVAAAPGNVERHQEFAELCFGLGEVDEGLDALRRASRANPSDPKASNTLADALSRQFRTEEAIELYWRAFDRTKELDARLAVVARLADQYLQRNQFDRLIARLERELREPERRRELALCLAQAYQGAGDLGTARQQLESLLSANPRDSALLTQLANLAEAEGDVAAASRYLKLALDVASTPEGAARLGNLYLRSGEAAEAEAVWARLASADQDASRAFAAIDSLLAAGNDATALTLTERLLLKRPDDWDALYRAGVALIRPGEAGRGRPPIRPDPRSRGVRRRPRRDPQGPEAGRVRRPARDRRHPLGRVLPVPALSADLGRVSDPVRHQARHPANFSTGDNHLDPRRLRPVEDGRARLALRRLAQGGRPRGLVAGPPGRGREARGRPPPALGPVLPRARPGGLPGVLRGRGPAGPGPARRPGRAVLVPQRPGDPGRRPRLGQSGGLERARRRPTRPRPCPRTSRPWPSKPSTGSRSAGPS